MNKHQLKNTKWIIASLLFVFSSMNINAEPKRSDPPRKPKQSQDSKNFRFSELDELSENEKTSYLSHKNNELNPSSSNRDAQILGNSIEFEVYKTSENKFSHTVFESGAGVCRGFDSKYGVDITDSRTYYIDKPKNEYYASISGATAYSQMGMDNMQYAPIFNIKDPSLARDVQSQEREKGKELAEKNIQKSIKMLETVICR